MFSKAVKSLKMFLVVLLLLSSVKAFANGVETHDGFFFRGLLGFGYGETVEKDYLGSDFEFSGGSGFGVLQIGGAVTENLIIFYEQSGFVISEPDVEWGGQSSSIDDGSVSVSNAGIGASYYFMPINMYVSMSLCASRAELEVDGDTGTSEWGFGTNIIVGKEWWVSDNWGLGVAGVFHYSKMESDEGSLGTKDVENKYYGIAFTATYN